MGTFIERSLVRVALITVVGSAVALSPGCRRADPDIAVIEEAQRLVAGANSGGEAVGNPALRRATLGQVVSKLTPLTSSDRAELAGTAAGLAARAQTGLAVLDFSVAQDALPEQNDRLASLRALLSTYIGHQSTIGSVRKSDFAGQQSSVEQALSANAGATQAAQRELDALKTKVAEFELQIGNAKSVAQANRAQAAELVRQADQVSATAGTSLVEQAAALRKTADGADTQVTELEMARLAASFERDRAQAKVSALGNERQSLTNDMKLLMAGAEAAAGQLRVAEAGAKSSSEAVTAGFLDLVKFRNERITPAFEKAASSARQAVTFAKTSSSKAFGSDAQALASGRQAAKLAVTSANQGLADVLLAKARAEQAFATAAGLLANSTPALPDSVRYREAAAASTKNVDELLGQARELYKEVRENIEGITDEKLKARLGNAGAVIAELASVQGVSADSAVPTGGASSSGSQSSGTGENSAAAGGDAATSIGGVKGLLDQYHDKLRAKDFDGAMGLIAFRKEGERQALLASMSMGAAFLKFDDACQKKFGKPASDVLGPMGQGFASARDDYQNMMSRTSADYAIELEALGDKAVATAKKPLSQDMPWVAKKSASGAWRFELPEEVSTALAMMGPMLSGLPKIFEDLASEIDAGKIADQDQLSRVFMQRMGAMMPGGGMGGGMGDPNK